MICCPPFSQKATILVTLIGMPQLPDQMDLLKFIFSFKAYS